MPYEIEQVGPNQYSVINRDTGRIHSYHTTLENAKAQTRLLYGIESGKFHPTHNLSHHYKRRRHESVLTR